jgi:hypothetical protein
MNTIVMKSTLTLLSVLPFAMGIRCNSAPADLPGKAAAVPLFGLLRSFMTPEESVSLVHAQNVKIISSRKQSHQGCGGSSSLEVTEYRLSGVKQAHAIGELRLTYVNHKLAATAFTTDQPAELITALVQTGWLAKDGYHRKIVKHLKFSLRVRNDRRRGTAVWKDQRLFKYYFKVR